MDILQSLGKGSIVIFQNDPQTYYFKNNKDGKTGFFLDKNNQPKLKSYSKITKLNGKPLTLYFKKSLNDKQGFFTDEQGGGPYKKDYKNIIKINGKVINEIKVNKPTGRLEAKIDKNGDMGILVDAEKLPTYGRFNNDKSKVNFIFNDGDNYYENEL